MEQVVGSASLDTRGELPLEQTASAPHGIRQIVVCLDRSPLSETCLPYAMELAKAFGSSVTLLFVLQPSQQNGALRTTDALKWEIARQEASAYLTRLEQETSRATGLHIDTRIDQGHPAERIVAVARELRADLTVLGNHGEGGLAAWELGSTVQQVLSVSRCSVLLSRGPAVAPRSGNASRILVPLDGSPRTESVLPTVVRIAKARGAEVLLAHVVTEPQRTSVLSSDEDIGLARQLASRIEAGAGRYLEQIRERLAREVAVSTVVLRNSDERESLLELVARDGVELVVLSAHGTTCNPARAFGSVSAHVLTHSTVPVLVLQDLTYPVSQRPGDGAHEQGAPPLRASYAPEGS